MTKSVFFIPMLPVFLLCHAPTSGNSYAQSGSTDPTFQHTHTLAVRREDSASVSAPKGYTIVDRIGGDLNGDGVADSILIVESTGRNRSGLDQQNNMSDDNRRGLIVFVKSKTQFRKVVENLNCFSSEDQDGGVYTPPELSVEVLRNKLYIHYAHGRYGFWRYTFCLRGADFELIGYDASNNTGPRIDRQVSINFLTKRRLERINKNFTGEGGDEVFEDKWTDISIEGLAQLSKIEDFDNLGEGGW